MKLKRTRVALRAAAILCLALGGHLAVAQPALAEGSCAPTPEQIAEYVADGSLAERVAYQEALSDDSLASPLSAQAESDMQTISWYGTLPRTGTGRVLALRVSFPAGENEDACSFAEDDTLEALQSLIDGNGGSAPYENLSAYYRRSSYGKLSLSGDAFDYTAAHPRSYYEQDRSLLFREALEALDDTLDYASYDGNGDDIIDCIVIHFAGKNTGWGSAWWSNERTLDFVTYDSDGEEQDELQFDGKRAGSSILLHLASNNPAAAQTLIHESGHALGLPDYYPYPSEGSDDSAGGILTFDMMNNNIGDHNGFSKWMLGWLDNTQVTWVTVADDGVTAERGGAPVGTPTADGGIALDLAPFTGDNLSQTGGVIVLATHNRDILSDYYLLQYDTPEGNQHVFWGPKESLHDLSCGFRLFRIQAQVGEEDSLAHSNTSGSLHNQFIELVDPDGDEYHTDDQAINRANTAEDGEHWGCMLYEGSTVGPSTTPSTNFFENVTTGWTGIELKVTRSDPSGGTIEVRHDPTGKPSATTPTLSPADGTSLITGGTIVLDADVAPTLNPNVKPTITLDTGETIECATVSATGTRITMRVCGDTQAISAAKFATVSFGEGAFLLYGGGTSTETSATVPTGGIPLADSGNVSGSSYPPPEVSLSPVFTAEDGTRYFYQCDSKSPYFGSHEYSKNVIDPNDPSKVTKTALDGDEAKAAQLAFRALSGLSETSRADEVKPLVPQNADLGAYDTLIDAAVHDNRVYVLSEALGSSANTAKALSVFAQDGTLLARKELGNTGHSHARLTIGPTGCVAATFFGAFFDDRNQQELTRFFDADLNDRGILATHGTGTSCWLEDGRFISYGWRYNANFAEGASIVDPRFALCYDITKPFAAADKPKQNDDGETEHGTVPTDPKQPTKPTDPPKSPTPQADNKNRKPAVQAAQPKAQASLPRTGDDHSCAAVFAVAGLVALVAAFAMRERNASAS